MSNIEGSSRPIEGPDQYSSGGGSNNTGGAYNSREYLRDFSKIDMVLLEELWARELGFDRAHDKTEQFKNLFNKQLGLDKYPRVVDGVNKLLHVLIGGEDDPTIKSTVNEILMADYKRRKAEEEQKKLQKIADYTSMADRKLIYNSAHNIDTKKLAIDGSIEDIKKIFAIIPVSLASKEARTGRSRLMAFPQPWGEEWGAEIIKTA